MSRTHTACGLRNNGPADDPTPWGQFETLQPQVLVPDAIEPGRDSLTVLLKNPGPNLSGWDDPLSAVAVATYRVPVLLPDGKSLIGYLTDVRGAVRKTAGARITLTVEVGETVRTLEFPYGEDADTVGAPLLEMFSLERHNARAQGGDPHPAPPLVLTFTASSQRRTPDETALLQVDSLDIRAVFA